jgi:hypothetical protein
MASTSTEFFWRTHTPDGMQSENRITKNVIALAFLVLTSIMVVYSTTILFDKVTIIG